MRAGAPRRSPASHPGSGVEIVGEVPSAAEFLRGLSLLLYPVRRGSGMKVKVLESLAAGVPVVTTRFGAEGIEPGAGVIVAEDDEALVAAAVALLEDAGTEARGRPTPHGSSSCSATRRSRRRSRSSGSTSA